MRWILVSFVCVAIATAALVDDYENSPDEEQNNVDIFMPRSPTRGHLDRGAREFHYKYWLYPAMTSKNRTPYMEMRPYLDLVEPLTFQDIFEKPVFVVTPSQKIQNTFSMFYVHNGLRSLHRYQAFSWLQEFFKHPGLKGLVFHPHLTYNVRFFETPITSITLQDDLRMSDFVSIENRNSGKIPYIFVAPEDVFDRMHFENIAKVSDFKVYNDAIEVHPIIAQPRPVYEPFYGPQPSPAPQQHHTAPPPQMPLASEFAKSDLSLNIVDFPMNKKDLIEQPVLVIQSGKLVATQAGRELYGGDGYGVGGQSDHGQNGGIGDQYGAQVDATYGVSGDVYGTQPGSKSIVTISTPGAQIVVPKDLGQLQADGHAHYYEMNKVSGNINSRAGAGHIQGAQVGISRVGEGAINNQISGQNNPVSSAGVSGGQYVADSVSRVESGSMTNQLVGSQPLGLSGAKPIDVVIVSRTNTGSLGSGQSALYLEQPHQLGSINSGSSVSKSASEAGHIQGAQVDISRVEEGAIKSQISGQNNPVSNVGVSGGQYVADSVSRVESGSITNQLVGSQPSGLAGAKPIDVVIVSRTNTGSLGSGQSALHLEQPHQLGSINSGSSVSKSASSSNVETSTISGFSAVSKKLVSGTRSLLDESTPPSTA